MEEFVHVETSDIDADRFILLEGRRAWPKYVVAWSIRRRSGETDFPLASGTLERMPPKDGTSLDELWEEMRAQALSQAADAGERLPAQETATKRPSLLDRLLGRR